MKTMIKAVVVLLLTVSVALAAPLKVQVGEFTVTGAANKDELKAALPALLASRLGSDEVLIVDQGNDVGATISGSYTTFGKTFSIDAAVKNSAGELLGRRYVQGDGPDELIPAVGKLAEQLRSLLPKGAVAPAAPVVVPVVAPKAEVLVAPVGDIVRAAPATQAVAQQSRLEGALLGIAPGRSQANGEREMVVADAKRVYLYRKAAGFTKLAEFALKGQGKILGVDTADVDQDGQLEVYLTVMDQEELVSVALAISDQGFTQIAERLPYFFRAIAANGKETRLYAQQTGRGVDDFYGDVCAVVKKGKVYSLGTPIKLPKKANIFTFNRFTDVTGKLRTITFDRDGNLQVYDEAGAELWQGNDRFGGSEVYFQRDEQQMQSVALDRYRWRFIEQRITVSPAGEIIVPRNSGLLSIGNNRSYSKNSISAFAWNGAALDERWHTKESASYLADYFYDAVRKELVTLEQVQKEGLFSKGASSIAIKKID